MADVLSEKVCEECDRANGAREGMAPAAGMEAMWALLERDLLKRMGCLGDG